MDDFYAPLKAMQDQCVEDDPPCMSVSCYFLYALEVLNRAFAVWTVSPGALDESYILLKFEENDHRDRE